MDTTKGAEGIGQHGRRARDHTWPSNMADVVEWARRWGGRARRALGRGQRRRGRESAPSLRAANRRHRPPGPRGVRVSAGVGAERPGGGGRRGRRRRGREEGDEEVDKRREEARGVRDGMGPARGSSRWWWHECCGFFLARFERGPKSNSRAAARLQRVRAPRYGRTHARSTAAGPVNRWRADKKTCGTA